MITDESLTTKASRKDMGMYIIATASDAGLSIYTTKFSGVCLSVLDGCDVTMLT